MSKPSYGEIITGLSGLSVFKGTMLGPVDLTKPIGRRRRCMNREEFDRYHKKCDQSKGFDVDGCTGFLSGRIVAIGPGHPQWELSEIGAKFAAYEHGGKSLEFCSLVRANIQSVRGLMYYLTFTAIDHKTADKEIKTYQAQLIYGPPSFDVTMLYFKEVKSPKKPVTASEAQGSKSSGSKISKAKRAQGGKIGGTKISKAKMAQGSMSRSSKISKAKKGTVLQASGVLPGFTVLLRKVKSQNPSMTHTMARRVASKKWKSFSNAEKQSFICEASQK